MVEVPKKCPGCDYPVYELRATGGGRLICAVCGRTAQCDDFGNWSWDTPSPACLAAQVIAARTARDEALRDNDKAKAEIAALKVRAERLARALRPFAQFFGAQVVHSGWANAPQHAPVDQLIRACVVGDRRIVAQTTVGNYGLAAAEMSDYEAARKEHGT
jgi:hypothetical protein